MKDARLIIEDSEGKSKNNGKIQQFIFCFCVNAMLVMLAQVKSCKCAGVFKEKDVHWKKSAFVQGFESK
ncbi:hypothetical protein [Paenibacillus sp. 481]|uniref:hypothetical protein n=1 Tax=Paenibacillus sp. 481 TaxID=2835869 RepID=UPI001E5673EF|nr:hypothetical protein [Paenibacillus sp. 481]UHA75194.1 hypothetical protein KIK04_09300 [Paenibacillus sp. 481]